MSLKNKYDNRKRFTRTPVDNTGMWYQDNPVIVPSNQITMKGPNGEPNYFDSPIMGIGMQSGEKKVMYPGKEYSFPNDRAVYERKMQVGGETSTEDNPLKMSPIDIKAKDKGWFDRNIQRPLRKWGRSYAKRIDESTGGSDWYKQSDPWMNFAFEAANLPQYTATYAATGKVQTPSEAMDIKNPYGAFAVDAVLDPTNLLGAGLLKQPIKSSTKSLAKTVDNVAREWTPKQSFKSEIDWGKWNPDTPKYPELMNEYNAIEESTKRTGTWMKNPDGSTFQGTPEQFVQQQSSHFKKAFGDSKLVNPDGSPTFQYHGSAKKFDTFDESKFQLGDAGYSGKGIYTTPSKTTANSYAVSSAKFHSGEIEPTVYQLYGQGNNPISAEDLIKQNKDYDLFNFHRSKDWSGDVPLEQQMLDYDVAIRNQTIGVERVSPWNQANELVFPTNKQLKSAVGNVGFFDMTNPNIYKAVAPVGIGLGLGASKIQTSNSKMQKGGLKKSYLKTKRFK